jgi:hypothetical protein
VVAATLRNDAGIIGAAIVAAEGMEDAATTFDDLPIGRPPAASDGDGGEPGTEPPSPPSEATG